MGRYNSYLDIGRTKGLVEDLSWANETGVMTGKRDRAISLEQSHPTEFVSIFGRRIYFIFKY